MRHIASVIAFAVCVATAPLAYAVDISGAGATFPFPVYAKWADAYKKDTGNGPVSYTHLTLPTNREV